VLLLGSSSRSPYAIPARQSAPEVPFFLWSFLSLTLFGEAPLDSFSPSELLFPERSSCSFAPPAYTLFIMALCQNCLPASSVLPDQFFSTLSHFLFLIFGPRRASTRRFSHVVFPPRSSWPLLVLSCFLLSRAENSRSKSSVLPR